MAPRPAWSPELRAALERLVQHANGKRSARVLRLNDVDACVARALESPLGFDWCTAGTPQDARALTSLCLAAVRDGRLTVGVGAAHGEALPSSVFDDLPAWHRYEPPLNRAAVLAWAGRPREDRLRVELINDPAPPPTTPEALLEQVRATPADPAPRLVYADLISEAGDPRGEFIALQCGRPSPEAEARAAALLAEHEQRWVPHSDALTLRFQRGFVEGVRCASADALDELHRVVRAEPVTQLTLTGPRLYDLPALISWPEAPRLTGLTLVLLNRGVATDGFETLRLLLETRWPSLEHLGFRGHWLGDEALRLLADEAGRAFPRLRRLALEEDTLTAAGVGELLNAKWVHHLEVLSLAENLLGPSGADVIAASRRVSRLRQLSLAGNGLGNEGAMALAHAAGLRGLESLDLRRNRIASPGVEALLASPHLRELRALELLGNPIGRAQWSVLRRRFGGE